MTCDRVLEILDAFADGELDAINGREVERHLSTCIACRGKWETRKALSRALRSKLRHYRTPEELHHKLWGLIADPSPPRETRTADYWRRSALPMAACLALMIALCTLIVIQSRTRPSPDAHTAAVEQALLSDHLRSLQGFGDPAQGTPAVGHLLDIASSDREKLQPWFSAKLPFSPAVRSLEGYELLGGRLDVVVQRPVAALVYRRQKHLLNLFTWPVQEKGEQPAGFAPEPMAGGYHAVKWVEGNMEYWVVSDAGAGDVLDFAQKFAAAAGSGG